MNGLITEQTHFEDTDRARPFSSMSFYATFILATLLPVGLWLTQASFQEVFADFDLEISLLTIWFLNPAMPFLLMVLPGGVVAKEFLVGDRDRRYSCDTVFAVVSLIGLVFAGLAFAVPFWELIEGLQG